MPRPAISPATWVPCPELASLLGTPSIGGGGAALPSGRVFSLAIIAGAGAGGAGVRARGGGRRGGAGGGRRAARAAPPPPAPPIGADCATAGKRAAPTKATTRKCRIRRTVPSPTAAGPLPLAAPGHNGN